MTCCKSTSTGVGIPTTAPTNNDPDIYIEQPSGQIWVWNGTQWTKPPIGVVSYNSTTRVLTVGSSSVTLPIASKTEYGVVKLADPATDPNNPIEANPDGTLTINCAKLITHCGLATKTYVDETISGLSGAQIVNLLTSMSSTDLAGLACKLKSSDAGNLLQCRANGLYLGKEAPEDIRNTYVDRVAGIDAPGRGNSRSNPVKTLAYALSGERLPDSAVTYNIFLKEGQVHNWDNIDSMRWDTESRLAVYTYGDSTDACLVEAEALLPQGDPAVWTHAGIPRAAIQFYNTEDIGHITSRHLTHVGGAELFMYAVKLLAGDNTVATPIYDRAAISVEASNIQLLGCDIRSFNDYAQVFGMVGGGIHFRSCIGVGRIINTEPIMHSCDVTRYNLPAPFIPMANQLDPANFRVNHYFNGSALTVTKSSVISSTLE